MGSPTDCILLTVERKLSKANLDTTECMGKQVRESSAFKGMGNFNRELSFLQAPLLKNLQTVFEITIPNRIRIFRRRIILRKAVSSNVVLGECVAKQYNGEGCSARICHCTHPQARKGRRDLRNVC